MQFFWKSCKIVSWQVGVYPTNDPRSALGMKDNRNVFINTRPVTFFSSHPHWWVRKHFPKVEKIKNHIWFSKCLPTLPCYFNLKYCIIIFYYWDKEIWASEILSGWVNQFKLEPYTGLTSCIKILVNTWLSKYFLSVSHSKQMNIFKESENHQQHSLNVFTYLHV